MSRRIGRFEVRGEQGLDDQSGIHLDCTQGNCPDPEEGEQDGARGKQSALDSLLRRIQHKSDFPALSESVSAINRIASSETESIDNLSNAILKDISLTNKLLRLVNSVYYRPVGGGSISTVSRAVIVLGFDAVRNIALSVLLFEHLQNKGHVNQLKEEFLRANLAGILARNLRTTAQMGDLEQTFICGLFHGLGRLLSQYYFPEESEEIRRQVSSKHHGDEQAAQQVLGLGFEELGIAVARQWGFPLRIVNTMYKLSPGPVRKPVTQEERLKVLAGISNELCSAIARATSEQRDKEMHQAMARVREALSLDEKAIRETILRSASEIGDFSRTINLDLKQTAFGRHLRLLFNQGGASDEADAQAAVADLSGENALAGEADERGSGEGRQQEDAQTILAAGIQDISSTLADGFKLNDILHIILETMYRAMGFKRILLCIKDVRTNHMQGRFGLGPEVNELARLFRFSLTSRADVFHAAASKGMDILISDIDAPKVAAHIPVWYRNASAARTFVLLPLSINASPVALIYADKDDVGSIVIPERELFQLRTLRDQALQAIRQGGQEG